MATRIRPSRTVENLVDDNGHVTHVKCSQCSWKVALNGMQCSDEDIRELFSFWVHDCDDHRIGAAFRK